LVIAAQPTRGLDVGSIEYIHRRIVEQRDAGAAVLIVSTELDEVLALGDRVAVMYMGKVVESGKAGRSIMANSMGCWSTRLALGMFGNGACIFR
jgi:ABC-type uncharacterized transport system ATPase subunit